LELICVNYSLSIIIYTSAMKRFIKTILTLLVLFVTYISVIEINAMSDVHHEVAVESVTQFDMSESELTQDTLLHSDHNTAYAFYDDSPMSEMDYILFSLEIDIFKPPLFT